MLATAASKVDVLVDLIQALGAFGTISIEQVGSYAGFGAVLGLAVLSALYFSQARDVKRLREWAGRAPERDAEARARVAAATAAGQQRQAAAAQPATAKPAAGAAGNATTQPAAGAAVAASAQPATANASGGNSGGATAAPAKTPEKEPAVAGAASASKAPPIGATAAAASGGAAVASATGPRGGIGGPARPNGPGSSRPSSVTSILGGQEPRERWYRRIPPRYIALILAGVVVVGGGLAVGAIQLLSDDGTTSSSGGGGGGEPAQQAAEPESPRRAPIRPADVSVAVLNATPVQGLANQFGDRAQAEGFKKDNVGNAPGAQQRAESVVLFAPGKEREARLVRRRFNVSNIEPVDPESQALAPQADVILVVGADNTQ